MPTFIPARGCTLHLAGVCVNRIGRGQGSMLIASLEGDPPDIYDIPLNGAPATIELHTANYIATQLGTCVGYGIAAYNNMIVYPQSGSTGCPDLLIGFGVLGTANYANAYQGNYPTALFVVRHCNEAYGRLRAIADPSIGSVRRVQQEAAMGWLG
jgi:hypothetical protein